MLIMDYNQNFCVVSLYHVSKSLAQKIKLKSDIMIKCPYVVNVELNFKGFSCGYQCIKVTDLDSFMVNGTILKEDCAQSRVVSTTFS